MKKTVTKKTSKKKAQPKSKAVAVKWATEGKHTDKEHADKKQAKNNQPVKELKTTKNENVVALKKQPVQTAHAAKPESKKHPFASFMEERFKARNFSGHARKLGSQDHYRKKAV